jgi:hypothetical protein
MVFSGTLVPSGDMPNIRGAKDFREWLLSTVYVVFTDYTSGTTTTALPPRCSPAASDTCDQAGIPAWSARHYDGGSAFNRSGRDGANSNPTWTQRQQ